jgi:hypothetical protein
LLGRCLALSSNGHDWEYLETILKGSDLDIARQGFFRGILELGDWNRALEVIELLNTPGMRNIFRNTYLAALSDFDPKKALYDMYDWQASGIDNMEVIDKVAFAIVSRIVKTSDEERLKDVLVSDAIRLLTKDREQLIGRALAEQNVNLAIKWFNSLDNEGIKKRNVLSGITTTQYASGDLSGMMKTIIDAENNEGGCRFVRDAMMNVAGRSPLDACRMIDAIPPEMNDTAWSAINILVDIWYSQDGAAVSSWVNGQKPGTRKDYAINAIAVEVYDSDPQLAMQWAKSIEDKVFRDKAIIRFTPVIPTAPE